MTRAVKAAAVAAAMLVPAMTAAAVAAEPTQVPELQKNSQVEIEYVEPTKSYLRPIYERMKKRQFLEQLQQFLAPLKLPAKLPIRMLQCNETNSYYQRGGGGLKLCYEWPEWVERLAPAEQTPEGFPREDVIVGAFLQVVLHEMGHAVFDLLQVPMIGREEDAADQIAAFVMLQFGTKVARRTLTGSAYFWKSGDRGPWPRTLYSDTHGTELQRYYNILCIAYGAEPDTFKDLVEAGLLPPERAGFCHREYEQVRQAFVLTILPHIDQDLLKIVRQHDWLKPEDGKPESKPEDGKPEGKPEDGK